IRSVRQIFPTERSTPSDACPARTYVRVLKFYACLAYKDQKNGPGAGLHLDCVKLGTASRWHRLWLVFAWAYYWLNVAGWDAEVRGMARHWRANTVQTRTHTLWRLGLWAVTPGGLAWRAICRRQAQFTNQIPPVGAALAPI
ncbi:MAG: hypothetical protein M0Z53_14620, partial [Thermaerobacter sp.]|nr:hypothetical protein [Thermaerobacter sp.]